MDTGGPGMRANDRLAQMRSHQAKQADLVTAKVRGSTYVLIPGR